MNTAVHQGRCFCGRVEFQVSGTPMAMGYRYGDSCRHGSTRPVNAFPLWQVITRKPCCGSTTGNPRCAICRPRWTAPA